MKTLSNYQPRENTMKATSFRDIARLIFGVLATLALVLGVSSYVVTAAPEAEAQTTIPSVVTAVGTTSNHYLGVKIQPGASGSVTKIDVAYPYETEYNRIRSASLNVDGVTQQFTSVVRNAAGTMTFTLAKPVTVTTASTITTIVDLYELDNGHEYSPLLAGLDTTKVSSTLYGAAGATPTTAPSTSTTTSNPTTTTTTTAPTTNTPLPPKYETINSYIDVTGYPAYTRGQCLYLDVVSKGSGEIGSIEIDFPEYVNYRLMSVSLKQMDSAIQSWSRSATTGKITVNFKPGYRTYSGQRFPFQFCFNGFFRWQDLSTSYQDNSTIISTQQVYVPTAKFKLEKTAVNVTPITIETGKQVSFAYDIKVTNVGDLSGKLPSAVIDSLQMPAGLSINDVAFALNGAKVTPVVNGTNYELSPSIWGDFTKGQSKTIRVTVNATPDSPLVQDVAANAKNYTCSDITKKDGFWNRVFLVGETDTSTTNNAACVRPFSNANTAPKPVPVPDNIGYLSDSVQNPPLQQRCGQNIAIVFDVSASIGSTGLSSVKTAGYSIINALAGSSANVGLFNFASASPISRAAEVMEPLSMSSDANRQTLQNAISNLQVSKYPDGGTNWEAALQRVIDANAHYDAVYFVTDGIPTANVDVTNNMRHEYSGNWTNTGDLERAIAKANQLKADNTHIEAITVGLRTTINEYLLKDSVYETYNAGVADGWRRGLMYATDSSSSTAQEGRANETLKIIERYIYGGNWYTRDVSGNIAYWSDGRRTPAQMINHVVGPNQADGKFAVTALSDFTKMATTLRNLIVGPCVANLTITKTIVNPDGSVKSPGENWSFEAEALTNNVVLEYDSSGTPVSTTAKQTKQTDLFGKTQFWIGAQSDQLVSVTETIPVESGYKLYQQAGKNAVCSMNKLNSITNKIEKISVPVTNKGATGFDLTMFYENELGAVRSVDCEVKNVEEIAEVSKQPTAGDPVVVNPDGSAMLTYTINVSNPAVGSITTGPVTEIFRLPNTVEVIGDVKLEFPATSGSTVKGAVTTIRKVDVAADKEAIIAQSVLLQKGASQDIKVTVPVKVKDMVNSDWGTLGRCDGDGGAVSSTGLPNSVSMPRDQDKSNNNACIPLLPPEPPLIKVSKVAYDADKNQTNDVPLDGAEFALFNDVAGKPDYENGPLMELQGNQVERTRVQPGYYWLVETKSPAGYQLLAQPVKLELAGDAQGWTAKIVDGSGLAYIDSTAGQPISEIWIKVADVTTSQLPRTGGTGLLLPIGFASLLLAVGFLMARRQKE